MRSSILRGGFSSLNRHEPKENFVSFFSGFRGSVCPREALFQGLRFRVSPMSVKGFILKRLLCERGEKLSVWV